LSPRHAIFLMILWMAKAAGMLPEDPAV